MGITFKLRKRNRNACTEPAEVRKRNDVRFTYNIIENKGGYEIVLTFGGLELGEVKLMFEPDSFAHFTMISNEVVAILASQLQLKQRNEDREYKKMVEEGIRLLGGN